jgi:hypothetical protein
LFTGFAMTVLVRREGLPEGSFSDLALVTNSAASVIVAVATDGSIYYLGEPPNSATSAAATDGRRNGASKTS